MKTICTNFKDLTQKPRENVYLYFAPNVEMFKRFLLSKPNDMPTAIWTDKQKKPWIDTKVTLGQYFQTQIFIASLNDLICKEIMKCT